MASKEVPTSQWTVSPVGGAGNISPPDGYLWSVILREVEHLTSPREHLFVMWLVVGRYVDQFATAAYAPNGVFSVRIDVPLGEDFTIAALQAQLGVWWKTNGHFPDDPPVIKH